MKITVAIDSLKGSLASMEAGNAAKGGILRVYPEAEVFVRPLAYFVNYFRIKLILKPSLKIVFWNCLWKLQKSAFWDMMETRKL